MEETSKLRNKNFLENSKLKDLTLEKINTQALKVEKYFKNQIPYKGEEMFTDDLFPPNFTSVSGKDSEGNPIDKYFKYDDERFCADDIFWFRASEIFNNNYAVFENKIESDDIVQGDLSDCYFTSVLSSLAKNPQLILQNFRKLEVQKNGYYEVCLRIDGVWKVVILDDYFPCTEDKVPIFAKPNGSEIWVMLLEKAWAKVNGAYSLTEIGYGSESLKTLTNFPIETLGLDDIILNETKTLKAELFLVNHYQDFSPKSIKIESIQQVHEHLWNKLYSSMVNNAIMVAISKVEKNLMEHLRPNGIVMGHEYSILNMHEKMVDGTMVRLLEIRNPHGKFEFKGKWSDNSSEWTEETRKIFNNYQNEDQGTFFMSFEDFLENFSFYEICHVIDPLCSKTFQIQKGYENKVLAFDFLINDDSLVGFSIYTKNRRFHRNIPLEPKQNYDFAIVKLSDNNFDLIGLKKKIESWDGSMVFRLKKGVYKIFLNLQILENFNYDKIRKINFNVSANNYFVFDFSAEDNEKVIFSDDFYLQKKLIINTENYQKIANTHLSKKFDTNYDYFYKGSINDYSKFTKKVDHRKYKMESYEEFDYNKIYILKKLPPLESDDKHSLSFDPIFLNDGNIYFGETIIVGANLVRTGRAIYNDKSRMKNLNEFFVGTFIDGQHEGFTIEYSNDTFQEYYVKDGKVNGEGRIFLRDGKVKRVIYENFVITKEEFVDEPHKYLMEFEKMFLPIEDDE